MTPEARDLIRFAQIHAAEQRFTVRERSTRWLEIQVEWLAERCAKAEEERDFNAACLVEIESSKADGDA